MKFFHNLILLISISFFLGCDGGSSSEESSQERPFITIWKTDNVGFGDDRQIFIRGGVGPYHVDWGDGQVSRNVSGVVVHTYGEPGTYNVSITGNLQFISFPTANFADDMNYRKLLSVEQWGDIQWTSMYRAFAGCRELEINASDAPDLSTVQSMSQAFMHAENLNQNINHWDVSSITEMQYTFYGATLFNQPLNNWDVSSVQDFWSMFSYASAFNQDLSAWDVSSGTVFYGVFKSAENFNQALNNWDMSAATDISFMFEGAINFNQDLNAWDTSSVVLMNGVFADASSFNGDVSSWNLASTTSTRYLFRNAQSFNQDISAWNVSSVQNMTQMFDSVRLSIENYDSLLIGWSMLSLQEGVPFGAGDSVYSPSSQSARDTLTQVYGWEISDGGVASSSR